MTIQDAKDVLGVDGMEGGRTDAAAQYEAETREHEPKAVSEILPLQTFYSRSQGKKSWTELFDHNTTPCRRHN